MAWLCTSTVCAYIWNVVKVPTSQYRQGLVVILGQCDKENAQQMFRWAVFLCPTVLFLDIQAPCIPIDGLVFFLLAYLRHWEKSVTCQKAKWNVARSSLTSGSLFLHCPLFFFFRSEPNRFDPFSYYITMADDPNWCLDFDFDDKKYEKWGDSSWFFCLRTVELGP